MFGFGRKMMFTGLLGAAVSAPYLMTKADDAQNAASGAWSQMFGSLPQAAASNPYAAPALAAGEAAPEALDALPATAPTLADMPLEGFVVHDLAEVMRFDVSPDWVYQHWARKSTALSDVDLFGVRVPLVTGTGVNDLAGSLTYYFGTSGQVERLTFRGRTGDARPLIELVVSSFGLRRQQPKIAGELLYEVRWNGRPMSRLRIEPASVVWASVPHATYSVELDLNRPGAARYLDEATLDTRPVPTHAPLQQPRAPL